MLTHLHMKNFALIDELSLDFYPGLNVLTGETGAGKSILIGGINHVLGDRASSDQVRSGADKALIEAVFSTASLKDTLTQIMDSYGIDWEEETIISREISKSGRNICRINGRTVPLAALKNISSVLVDLHGQHSHQSLLRPEQHMRLLDEFGDEELLQVKNHFHNIFHKCKKIKEDIKSYGSTTEDRQHQLELLRHQAEEIEQASLSSEEEEALNQKLLLMDNMEKLLYSINNAYMNIYGGESFDDSIVDRLNSITRELSALVKLDDKLSFFVNTMEETKNNLTELGHELYSYLDSLQYSPEEREEVESRLETYRRLKRKYGSTVEEVLSFAENCQEEISELEKNEKTFNELQEQLSSLEKELENTAASLSQKRRQTAQNLEQEVNDTLNELAFEGGKFSVDFRPLENVNSSGREEIEFLFSANPGEPLKPLVKIISAGEMARVMLALKSILAEQDEIPTLVFDEIDSGIGGKTIYKVAEKLSKLSERHQVICVTHSPHIASAANYQYHIYKKLEESRTITRVKLLQDEERISEVARLLDGSINNEITRKHAEELLKKVK